MDRSAREAHEHLLSKISESIKNTRQRTALYAGTEPDREKSEKTLGEAPDGEALLREARRIKREAIDRLDENLARFVESAKTAGVNVHVAEDAAAAVNLVTQLCTEAGAKRIVKSKSMTTEEIELRQHLQQKGFEVVETDLGERIIQLADQRPCHMVGPAIHLTVDDIAELFSKVLGRRIPPDPEEITAMSRESLREVFLKADVGITGANFAIADSGALVLVTNEGNGRLVTALPKMTIAIFGSEKIVPSTSDALVLMQALVMSAVSRRLTSYVSFIKGGSKLAQTGQEQEQHFIILDNGRSRMRADPTFKETLYCLRCGACADACPTFRLVGGHLFGHIYTGPIGIPWTEYTATPDQAGEFAHLCISCGLCQRACPEDIDIPLLIAQVKERYVQKHGQLPINRILCNYESFVALMSSTSPLSNFLLGRKIFRSLLQGIVGIDSRRPFPPFTRHTFKKWFRTHASVGSRKVAYFVDTYADMCEPEIGKAVVGILESNDCKVTVPKQVGCGMPAFLYGDVKRTHRTAEFNIQHLAEAVREGNEVVCTEPTATYCLKELYPLLLASPEAKLVAEHSHDLFELLLQFHQEGKLKKPSHGYNESAVYYAPCHTRSVYGKSNALDILKLAGVDARPVRYNTCCGIAGTFGFKKGAEGYDVSKAIGETLFERIKAMNLQLVITESSVCKMQIEHGLSMRVLHPATVLWDTYQAKQ